MQSKFQSIKEAFSQSLIGVLIGLLAIRTLLPLVENLDKNIQSLIIVLIMFIFSTLRGYIIRRYFNKKEK